MKTATILFFGLLAAGCSNRAAAGDDVSCLLRDAVPAKWVVTSSVDPRQFWPLRGLTHAVEQVTLTDESTTITRSLIPGESEIFHPTLTLLVFPIVDLLEVEYAVQKEAIHSDYPPDIFGLTDHYVLVTSPGYVNQGLHTPEAEATIEELKELLKGTVRIRW